MLSYSFTFHFTFAMLNHKYLKHRWGQELQKSSRLKPFHLVILNPVMIINCPQGYIFIFTWLFCGIFYRLQKNANEIKWHKISKARISLSENLYVSDLCLCYFSSSVSLLYSNNSISLFSVNVSYFFVIK